MARLAKGFGAVLIILFIASLVAIPPANVKAASPKTIVVPDDFGTIQEAINHAKNGDTVFVKEGTYTVPGYDTIHIDKSISLIGENSQSTVIAIAHYFFDNAVVNVEADNVTISGFTIEQGENGIRSFNNSRCVITGNNIKNNSVGITWYAGKENIISGNNITKNNGDGIFVSCLDSLISDNTFTQNWDAIGIDNCQNVTIKQNNIYNNTNGVILGWTGPFYVYQNNVSYNLEEGIEFYDNCSGALVYSNSVVNNKIGFSLITVFNSSFVGHGNKVYNNSLQDNGRDIQVDKSPTDEVSFGNDVTSNISVLTIVFVAVILCLIVVLVLFLYRRHRKIPKA